MDWIRTDSFRYCQNDITKATIDYFDHRHAQVVSHILTLLETPSTWSVFSRSKAALELRKKNPYGAVLNEAGELMEKTGIMSLLRSETDTPTNHQFQVIHAQKTIPERIKLLGKEIVDYSPFHQLQGWRILPLKVEVKFNGVSDFPSVTFFDSSMTEGGSAIPLERAVSVLGLDPKKIEQMWIQSIWISVLIRSLFDASAEHIESMRWAWAYHESEPLRLASGSSLIPWDFKYHQLDSELTITERVLSCAVES